MSVTLRDIVLAVRYGDAALVGESCGYLVLGATDLALQMPRQFSVDSVGVHDEGQIVVDASSCSAAEAEASLRHLLEHLLGLVRSPCPNLQRVAARKDTRGLRGLQCELEAGLVPVNRKAARRSLARLVRETKKSVQKGRSSVAVQPLSPRVPPLAEPPASSNPIDEPPPKSLQEESEVEVDVDFDPGVEPASVSTTQLPETSDDLAPASPPPSVPPGGRAAGHGPRPIFKARPSLAPGPLLTRFARSSGNSRARTQPPCAPHRDAPHRDAPHRDAPHRDVPSWDLVAGREVSVSVAEEGVASPQRTTSSPASREEADTTPTQVYLEVEDRAVGAGDSALSPPAPPELTIDTTPTEVYAPVSDRSALEQTTHSLGPGAEFDLSPVPSLAATPNLTEVSEAAALEAERRFARERLQSSPSIPTPTAPPSSRKESMRTPDGVSLLPPSSVPTPRRPTGIDELLERFPVAERPDDELYAGLKQLSQLDVSPWAPPVGSTWIKGS